MLDEDKAKELIELADSRHRILMVGHLLQYHPAFLELKRLVSEGELGKINYICSHRLNLGKIRREENILWSFAPHDISMILALADSELESVMTAGANYLHQRISDVTTTHMEFASGMKAHIFVSWLHPFKEQKLVVVGEKKMAVFDDTLPWAEKLLLYPHEINWENNVPVPAKANGYRLELPDAEPLKLECLHFIECASEGKAPRTDGREGLEVLRVLNASQQSLNAEGKKIFLSGKADTSAQESAFVHETAVVDAGASVGHGSHIWHFSHVMSGATIGRNVNIGQNVFVGKDVSVGDGCKIQNNVSVYPGVTLEENVFCGPSMVFTNVFNPRANIRRMEEMRRTHVGKGATLGANCTIVCGNNIGRHAFVGAGAVVTADVPDHALVMGNPARVRGWMCECGNKLDEAGRCPACGKEYSNRAAMADDVLGRDA
ncbi:UDP-2-acetamido-3-amino-2,3-dideoxy-glucuronate N-acetyltransferase [Desulfomicrobium macestii]|uniref:UDP-2-acetamido-3-amino-2,3-dideoxy-glucuronate N-acetyltransferase n=1 Tax=Desulfomicrobium macestii TaxID=90731 RepID=A0ABR9H6S4_9BACT|nr:UDP-2-acetamido-3-amino-2,3-dideoxy-glucuronate N-acetyltransferase [Desulfomicrobium macestii]